MIIVIVRATTLLVAVALAIVTWPHDKPAFALAVALGINAVADLINKR